LIFTDITYLFNIILVIGQFSEVIKKISVQNTPKNYQMQTWQAKRLIYSVCTTIKKDKNTFLSYFPAKTIKKPVNDIVNRFSL